MLRFLFQRLTDGPSRGQPLFERLVAEARRPHWYCDGGVPDTIDGRFAMLATVCALATVRIERTADGAAQSAALSERFIEAMDAEHRQMGINDPALGRKVRLLVAALGRRVESCRETVRGDHGWPAFARASIYGSEAPEAAALSHSAEALRALWSILDQTADQDVIEGRF